MTVSSSIQYAFVSSSITSSRLSRSSSERIPCAGLPTAIIVPPISLRLPRGYPGSRAQNARALVVSVRAHLSVVEERDDEDAADDVPERCGRQPREVRARPRRPVEDRGEDLAARRDAVREVRDSEHERQHPDDHDLPDRALRRADEPGDERHEPAAEDAADEHVAPAVVAGVPAEPDEMVENLRLEATALHRQQR